MEVNCQCTQIGSRNEEPFIAESDHGLYLNTADPAPCNGIINGWRYCFYNPTSITNSHIYSTSFAVYRAVGTEDIVHYQRVSNVTTVSWRGSEIDRSPSFNCYDLNVNSFTIEAGDFVAACLYDPSRGGRTRQLDIVGQNSDGFLMRNDEIQCSENPLPSNILNSQFSVINRILHLYATITSTFKVCTTSINFIINTYDFSTVHRSHTYNTPSDYNI